MYVSRVSSRLSRKKRLINRLSKSVQFDATQNARARSWVNGTVRCDVYTNKRISRVGGRGHTRHQGSHRYSQQQTREKRSADYASSWLSTSSRNLNEMESGVKEKKKGEKTSIG